MMLAISSRESDPSSSAVRSKSLVK